MLCHHPAIQEVWGPFRIHVRSPPCRASQASCVLRKVGTQSSSHSLQRRAPSPAPPSSGLWGCYSL